MRNKKTIRKLAPLARKAAKLSRAIRSTQRAIDNLCEEIATLEAINKALERLKDHQADMIARHNHQAATDAASEASNLNAKAGGDAAKGQPILPLFEEIMQESWPPDSWLQL
jgi:Mg2+ and Co2+ transporter CorA